MDGHTIRILLIVVRGTNNVQRVDFIQRIQRRSLTVAGARCYGQGVKPKMMCVCHGQK